MEVREGPRRMACSQAMEMLIKVQRIIPGRSSLKDLMSKEPIRGLSSRPMNHWKGYIRDFSRDKDASTHIVNKVSSVTAKSKDATISEGAGIDEKALYERVDECCGDDASPMSVDEGECARTTAEDETGRETQSKQEC